MTEVNRPHCRFLVAMTHAGAQVTYEATPLLKVCQLLLVLFAYVLT